MTLHVEHRASLPYAYPIGPDTLRVIVRADRGAVRSCTLVYGDRYAQPGDEAPAALALVATDEQYDYFQGEMQLKPPRFRYAFRLDDGVRAVWLSEGGLSRSRPSSGFFQYPYINRADLLQVPDWIVGGVVYQIFPERFANGSRRNDPDEIRDWSDERPSATSFYGGDLKGVIDRLEHLKRLGITVLYLNPIFLSPSNHKYDTTDYYRIDPHFGDEETLKELVDQCHAAGIRVILDAVFNHCGFDFFAFRDVREKGAASKYVDWFHLDGFPVVTDPPNYETFANGIASMPKLRTENPEVRAYLLDVARYWIERCDIDGWRIDVANEVDHEFWREFRRVVKAAKPDAYVVGEIWHEALPWLQGDQFDGVTNYPFRDACIDFFARGSIDAATFAERLSRNRMAYPLPVLQASWNLLGSHDTERFMTVCGSDVRKVALAVAFQLMWIGTPMLYYGDEIGMEGQNDPDCRRPMIWDVDRWHHQLWETYRRLIGLRLSHRALTHGDARVVLADPLTNVAAFLRAVRPNEVSGSACGGTSRITESPGLEGAVLVALNNSPRERYVAIPMGRIVQAAGADVGAHRDDSGARDVRHQPLVGESRMVSAQEEKIAVVLGPYAAAAVFI